jgi:2-polyprenyl-3-methyl-5-hydroxy-6-metoxy-1,4-benzoquinol methylase
MARASKSSVGSTVSGWSALKRRTKAALGMPLTPLRQTFVLEDVGRICEAYYQGGNAVGGPWDAWRDAHMSLPSWFEAGLDPWGEAYSAQQDRLWQAMAGVDATYCPEVHEAEQAWDNVDPLRLPGYFARRDAGAILSASDHVIAGGMLLKHSGLRPGDRALEYGPGFGQTALTLARLGVQVDTVDISHVYCEFVRRQAEFFNVPLTAVQGRFGAHPRPGSRYRLIWFYESFHHCRDFISVVAGLRELLEPDGRILLGGEPIVPCEDSAVPYPWGLRLHSEVAAVVRRHRWFELGFTEPFLYELFLRHGFKGRHIDCEPTPFGRLYIFEPESSR